MKSFAAVAMNSMHYVLEHKPAVKFGVILSTDEEQGSKSTHAFMARYPELNVGVVLDNDVGGDIGVIINKCKNPGVCPADGGRRSWSRRRGTALTPTDADADDCRKLRRFYPYFDVTEACKYGLIPCMRRASAAAMFPTSFPGGRRRCWISG